MDLAHLSKHWTKHVEHELTQLFASMGDSWVPHSLVDLADSDSNESVAHVNHATNGLKRGMDASGMAANDRYQPRHH